MVEQIERARSIHSSDSKFRAMNLSDLEWNLSFLIEESKRLKGKRRW